MLSPGRRLRGHRGGEQSSEILPVPDPFQCPACLFPCRYFSTNTGKLAPLPKHRNTSKNSLVLEKCQREPEGHFYITGDRWKLPEKRVSQDRHRPQSWRGDRDKLSPTAPQAHRSPQ